MRLFSRPLFFFPFQITHMCSYMQTHTPTQAWMHTHANTHTWTHALPLRLPLGRSKVWIGLSFTPVWNSVCVCVRGGVQLIQVLSRREDKNLLPACWASESANRREVDPHSLCPGPVRLMAQTSFTVQETENHVRQRGCWNLSYLNLHIINLCKHEPGLICSFSLCLIISSKMLMH